MTNTVILYCDSVRFLPPRAATKRAMAGGRREEVDLNFSIAVAWGPPVSAAVSAMTNGRREAPIARRTQCLPPVFAVFWTRFNHERWPSTSNLSWTPYTDTVHTF